MSIYISNKDNSSITSQQVPIEYTMGKENIGMVDGSQFGNVFPCHLICATLYM